MEDHTATILNSETQELLETRDTELKKVLKLKLISNEARRLNLGSEQSSEVRYALKLMTIKNYLRLGETEKEQLLDLQNYSSCPQLSYTDRKAVRIRLADNLRKTLKPIENFEEKLRSELPDIFVSNYDTDLTVGQQSIIRLEEEHRANLNKLVNLRSRQCALLKIAAELKMGAHLGQELKFQQAKAQLLQTKVELLRCFFVNNVASLSEHSIKAHKEVSKHIDELLKSDNASADN